MLGLTMELHLIFYLILCFESHTWLMVTLLGSAVGRLDDCTSVSSLLPSPPDCPLDILTWMSNMPHCHFHSCQLHFSSTQTQRPWSSLVPPSSHTPHPAVSKPASSSFRVLPKSYHLSPLPHPGSSPTVSWMAASSLPAFLIRPINSPSAQETCFESLS